jgi:hypothetical protein
MKVKDELIVQNEALHLESSALMYKRAYMQHCVALQVQRKWVRGLLVA